MALIVASFVLWITVNGRLRRYVDLVTNANYGTGDAARSSKETSPPPSTSVIVPIR